ncbi:MAG: glyoxalase, partial [Microbacterium sp.]|nr:glyoxalase [Microbacterium sp.]
MGAVTLDVADLDGMTAYYRDAVGLSVLDATGPVVTLGRAGDLGTASVPLVILRHSPELKHAGPREAGLFHTAILFETQAALAAAVYTVATSYPQRFT